MIIELEAFDTLFFRDGKPFTMGEENWANTIFPPYPSVIYGALRTAYFSNNIEELDKAGDKDRDPTKNLVIKGICLKIGSEIYFPLPFDCVKIKKENTKNIEINPLKLTKNEFITNCPTSFVFLNRNSEEVENVPDGLVRKRKLQQYLRNPHDKFHIQRLKYYVTSEPKVGIAIDKKTGTSKEGMIYKIDLRRFETYDGTKLNLIVDFDGITLPNKGFMRLGGEGKAIVYREITEPIAINETKLTTNKFKIYLSTPTIFKKGWLPSWIDEHSLEGDYKNVKVKLLSVSMGKPLHIGGFDIKNKRPKPMFKAVPPGSVYCFELINGSWQDVVEAFHNKSISDYYREQGFGISFVGNI